MEKHFMKSYLNLVVKTCRSRGAPATGGMAAAVFSSGLSDEEVRSKTADVVESKRSEILAGVSGFLIYDFNLIQPIRTLWKSTFVSPTLHKEKEHLNISSVDLLSLPAGGVTMEGLKLNIAVGVLFINGWLGGRGTFVYKGGVEDSATAEISRMQVWQWLRHEVHIENSILPVTRSLVLGLLEEDTSLGSCEVAKKIFLDVVLAGKPPEFITTYLNDIYCR
ncbi:malate synthase, glyoxysomal [Eurytemora carolleeae]|uniref:malate synthase, glyoxysomal n=1 Tax=Eurytemora carolleeae TaxID=1294199 RepID=UPI000C773730|nr:malate synthase, glyoxysomal [Eurytemora carolleeae]|eukprot:XP_023346316.1 malate synthase, glyoxysomal-like [Eurytemora affinis]